MQTTQTAPDAGLQPERGNRLSAGILLLKRHNDAVAVELQRLRYVLVSAAVIGALIIVNFATKARVSGQFNDAFFVSIGIAGLFTVVALIKAFTNRDLRSTAFYASIASAALATGLIAGGGVENTGLYWAAPLICMQFFFMGANGGLFISSLLLIIVILEMYFPDIIPADYADAHATEALAGALALTALCYFNEHFRSRSHEAMSSQHTDKMVEAVTDPLTGLTNRRFLDTFYFPACKTSPKEHFPLGCIVCDIDHFKQVNDTYGHAAGDSVLKKVANLLANNVRGSDVVSRVGGEEFLVLTQMTDIAAARRIAESMRVAIEALEPKEAGGRITASFGLSIAESPEELESVITAADECLYKAKNNGRNNVHCDY